MRREDLGACRRELERKRKAIESTADLGDLAVRRELGADRLRPLRKERDRLLLGQWRYVVLVLAREMERRPARHEQAEPGCRGQKLSDFRAGIEQLLEVVEQKQHRLLS